MISSDMPELLSMSDRIGIMRKGEMVKIIDDVKDITEEKILTYSIGVKWITRKKFQKFLQIKYFF